VLISIKELVCNTIKILLQEVNKLVHQHKPHHNHTTPILRPFFRDHLGETVTYQQSPIFTPDALPSATLPIYPGLGHAQEYAGLHIPVAWLHQHNYVYKEICIRVTKYF